MPSIPSHVSSLSPAACGFFSPLVSAPSAFQTLNSDTPSVCHAHGTVSLALKASSSALSSARRRLDAGAIPLAAAAAASPASSRSSRKAETPASTASSSHQSKA
jgi:hypothetical protein